MELFPLTESNRKRRSSKTTTRCNGSKEARIRRESSGHVTNSSASPLRSSHTFNVRSPADGYRAFDADENSTADCSCVSPRFSTYKNSNDNNASEKAPEWSFAQSSLSPRELFPEHGRLTSSTQKFGSSFPHQASPRQQPLSSHNLPTDQSGAFGCLRAATPPLANDTPPSQTLPGDSRFKNPNHIPLQNSRITARDRQAKHSNQVKIYEPSFKKTVTELVAPIDKSELSDDDLLQKLRSLEHKFQAAIVEIESLKKIGKLNEDLIIELKEVKLVQEQKIRAAKLWHSELVQLRDENVRLRDSNTEVKEQNLRFRTDLIAYSHEINAMQIANCAEEDGTLRKRLIKYRKERDLARDKLKIFAMENGKDWREWMTKTDQVAAIGDEESFNMYEQLKKKRRK